MLHHIGNPSQAYINAIEHFSNNLIFLFTRTFTVYVVISLPTDDASNRTILHTHCCHFK